MKTRICTYNKIAREGLDIFPGGDYDIGPEMEEAQGILLRSHKLQLEQAGQSLLAVGRAGAGVNNIPVQELTEQGIVVFNTPGANANAVAELTMAMLLMVRRNLYAALRYTDKQRTDISAAEMNTEVEASKKAFVGSELTGSRLGIIGLGAIGSRIAQAAIQMGMEVYGYDPAITVENAWRIPSQCHRCDTLDSLLASASLLTVHVPAIEQTVNMIDESQLAQVKPGTTLLNFSRAEIVREQAVLQALQTGQLAGYVSDFPSPALCARQQEHGDVLLVPHLGASTAQAEVNCAVMAARQLRDILENGNITNSVNFPNLALEWATSHRLTLANRNVPRMLGGITSAFAQGNVNIVDMANKSRESVAWTIVDVDEAPTEDLLASLQSLEGVLRVRVLSRTISPTGVSP